LKGYKPIIYFNQIEKVLDIEGYQIPLLEVKILYVYNNEFGNHLVGFNCNNSSCIYNSKGKKSLAFSVPFISKQKCYEFIDLINKIKAL
jgi:hypothetical protein